MKRATIAEFLAIKETRGTMETVRAAGEELQMHHIMVHHNLFDCGNCDPWLFPVKVCRENVRATLHPVLPG